MAKYVMALDAGTTSNKCAVLLRGSSGSIFRNRAG